MKKLQLLVSSAIVPLAFATFQPIYGTDDIQNLNVNSHHRNLRETDVKKVEGLQRNFYTIDSTLTKEVLEEKTIILGNTQSGKSTIFNIMSEQDIQYQYKDGIAHYQAPNGQQLLSKIVHGFNAGTSLPLVGKNFIDTPGLNDNRSWYQSASNAYSLCQIFQRASNFKILLAINYNDIISNRGSTTCEIFNRLGTVFDEDLQTIIQSMAIIITNAPENQRVNFIQRCFTRMVKNRPDLNEQAKIIINSFTTPNGRVGMFHKPPERIDPTPVDGNVRTNIQQLLAPIAPTSLRKGQKLKLNEMIDETGKRHLETLTTSSMNDFKKLVKSRQNKLYNDTKSYIEKSNKSAHGNRNLFRKYAHDLKRLIDNRHTNQQFTTEDLITTAGGYNEIIHQLYKNSNYEGVNYEERFIFLQSLGIIELHQHDQLTMQEIRGNIGEQERYFKSLSEYKVTPDNSNQIEIQGAIIDSGDIQNAIDRYRERSQVSIFCPHSLIINDNITAPSTDFYLLADQVITLNDNTIDLSGGEAEQPEGYKSREGEGRDGNDGNDGGSFYGYCSTYPLEKRITVRTHGGNGTNGVNGKNGQEGSDARILPKPKKNGKAHRYGAGLNTRTKQTYIFATEGTDGEDGKPGGKYGRKGKHGVITFQKDNDNILDQYVNQEGNDGQNGNPGNPGIGGQGGRDADLIFTQEVVKEEAMGKLRDLPNVKTMISTISLGIAPLACHGMAWLHTTASKEEIKNDNHQKTYRSPDNAPRYQTGQQGDWPQAPIERLEINPLNGDEKMKRFKLENKRYRRIEVL